MGDNSQQRGDRFKAVSNFLSPFFPDPDEHVYLRALPPKDAPVTEKNRATNFTTTRRNIESNKTTQDYLIKLNETRGIYFVVNPGGQSANEIKWLTSVFAENDTLSIQQQHALLDTIPIKTSARIETKKSVHAYWLFSSRYSIEHQDKWQEAQERAARYIHGDESLDDLPQLMRLPYFNHVSLIGDGSLHFKPIKLVDFQPDRRYTIEQILEAFPSFNSEQTRGRASDNGASGRKKKKVPHIISEKIKDGKRNETLISLAGTMRRRGMSVEAIFAALMVENKARCEPPLLEDEVRRIAESVCRYAPEEASETFNLPDLDLEDERTEDDPSNPDKKDDTDSKTDSKSDSSKSDDTSSKPKSLFKTFREMRETCEKVNWLAPGYIAIGAVTELIGRVKEGKTTLILSLVYACLTGGRWLERRIAKQPVIYLTEQPRVSFISQMQAAGPLSPEDAENLHVLSYAYVRNKKLPELIVAAEKLAKQIGAKLVIIDSFGRFAGFLGDSENNSGTGQQAMDALVWAASRGLAPVSLRHATKGNGRDVQDAGRGSSAISGSADILIQLKRLEGNQDESLRELAAIGRFDAIPERVTIRYDKETGNYELLGESQAVRRDTAKAAILAILPGDEASALTEAEITTEAKASRSTVQRVLKELLKSGEAQKTGSGKRGDPVRYYAPFDITVEDDAENDSAQTSGGLGRKKPPKSGASGQQPGDAAENNSAQYKKGGLGRNKSEQPVGAECEDFSTTASNGNSESEAEKGFCPNSPYIDGQKEYGDPMIKADVEDEEEAFL